MFYFLFRNIRTNSLINIVACILKEGRYDRRPVENNWHLVQISKISEGKYEWKNSAGAAWYLFEIPGESNVVEVGKECPYYKDGYIRTIFTATGIRGPADEFYTYIGILM